MVADIKQRRLFFRSALFSCGLLLVVLAVPVVAKWRQENLNLALMQAVYLDDKAAVLSLLRSGASPNATNAFPLSDRLRWVVQRKSLAAYQDDEQHMTALMLAVDQYNVPLIHILLDWGANTNATTENGLTALKIENARRQRDRTGKKSLATLLQQAGAKG